MNFEIILNCLIAHVIFYVALSLVFGDDDE